MKNTKVLSYTPARKENETLTSQVESIIAEHNAKHNTHFSYSKTKDNGDWIVSDPALTDFYVTVVGKHSDRVLTIETGSSEDDLFRAVLNAVAEVTPPRAFRYVR